MTDPLFDVEQFEEAPEAPVFRLRRSEGDARHRGEYPDFWDRCPACLKRGYMTDALYEDLLTRKARRSESLVALERWWPPTPDPRVVSSIDAALATALPEGVVICPWCEGMGSLKGRVRFVADHRCVRCAHPYVPKGDARMLGAEPSWREGGWSPCDKLCTHPGPIALSFFGKDDPSPEPGRLEIAPGETFTYGGRHFSGWTAPRALLGLDGVVGVEAAWRVLTVHHLDCDKSNCRWWNLAALCQRCHLEIQSKVVMERIYPHAHSGWFRPYAAGYYAFVYLGEELSRAQAEAREDELLMLELDPSNVVRPL